ncbi:hypothetical protein [Bradyrhizobium sp.]|uniref:hypothetical protein n=1 Tax=Bradyrhizobium sp. TaxID=376 RepID=UPI002733614E|nr:hypothetical protein [Bradyrhizobium sp.]MDP3689751.1 hypothetical protein [Bradyrhizobium sp.]
MAIVDRGETGLNALESASFDWMIVDMRRDVCVNPSNPSTLLGVINVCLSEFGLQRSALIA